MDKKYDILNWLYVKSHFCRIAIMILFIVPVVSSGQDIAKTPHNILETDFFEGTSIRLEFLKADIIRIRISDDDNGYHESGLNRYGFIQDIDPGDLNVNISDTKNNFTAETSSIKVTGNRLTGEILVTNKKNDKILLRQLAVNISDNDSNVTFEANQNEDWIGFGDQSRERLYHRGYIADCNVRNVKSYIPVPFFMSTLGVGVLVNSTHKVVFDMCKSNPDKYFWKDGSGFVDYYVMTGDGFRELLDLYTELTGKPKLPPEWAFGLWYICRTQANDYEAVNDALNFRREEIPCDVIGLEPGWMEKNYDFSTQKSWSKERFPIPSYAFKGPHNFIDAIKRMGFKLELWLCIDYDLSYEEERRLEQKNHIQKEVMSNKVSRDFVERDGHLVKSGTSAEKEEESSEKEEPWFEHLKKFVDQGIDFFKQDGSKQVLDHPDKIWGNGMQDEEMHNLYPLFYSRQMYEGFKEHTGRRPVVFTPSGWTGFQAWSGTWTGDTGGRLVTLGAMLNTSIVGHSWATNDMEVTEKEGIHFGYLQPWSQINSWNYFRMPWIQGTELTQMHKYYARLRSQLIPYLYSWAFYATKTGWPLLIPLTMEFQNDQNCRNNLHQYLLGRDMLVGIYRNMIYFPEGDWKDYWTGEVIDGQQELEVSWPSDRGGALYIRSGAIIPFGPIMQYRGEKPMNEMTLYVFPDEDESTFDLYEDDGLSFDHLNGKFSVTHFSSRRTDNESIIQIGEARGDFEGKVSGRIWKIIMHVDKRPVSVWCNKNQLSEDNYNWDSERKELAIEKVTAPAKVVIKN